MPEKPLRILIGADTYPPDINGAAQFGHRLAMGMRDRGHEVHVVAARTGAGPSETSPRVADFDRVRQQLRRRPSRRPKTR